MEKQLNKVAEFQEVFKVGNNTEPTLLSNEESRLRHKLMLEEVQEYGEATLDEDLVEIADALGDQLYILCGTILRHGLQDKIIEIFEEIHRSNMSKLDANGEPVIREDGKIIKSDRYFKPELAKILLKKFENGQSKEV